MTPQNPPAFPVYFGEAQAAPPSNEGMSLRDWFAGQAMSGLLAANGPIGDECRNGDGSNMAIWCYHFADAMLAERQKKGTP